MGTHPIFESDFDCLTDIEMGKSKRKNYHPSSLQELEPDLRIISSITFRDILWREGDLVSVLEDDEEYYAQIRGIVQSRLTLPGCVVRWLYPNPDNGKWEVGPDEERILELTCLNARGAPPEYLPQLKTSFEGDNWTKLRNDVPRTK